MWVVHGLVYHYIPCVSFYVLCVPECVKKARTMVRMCIFMYPHVLSHIPMYFNVFPWIAIRWIGCIFMYVHFCTGFCVFSCICTYCHVLSQHPYVCSRMFTFVHALPVHVPRACVLSYSSMEYHGCLCISSQYAYRLVWTGCCLEST